MSRRPLKPSRTSRSAATGSWLAFLAATTLGDAADTLRAEVRADGLSDGRRYRLVVQSYDTSDSAVPGLDSRPVGSTQRAVTADELREGVKVDLLELRQAVRVASQKPLIVAWVEVGGPDLEFDARSARPTPGSVYGLVERDVRKDVVQIDLNRRA